jgi:uncharacterized protein YcfL
MKKYYFTIAVTAVIASVMVTGCRSSKQAVQTHGNNSSVQVSETQQKIKAMEEEAALIEAQKKLDDAKAASDRASKQREADAAIAEQNANLQASRAAAATEQPCQMYDDDEWFYATGVRQFKMSSVNTAPTALLRSTQLLMRQKLAGVYKAVLRDYFDQMNTDEGNYANEHIESAGDLVIRANINETYEVCRKNTAPDGNGNVTMYMSIKVSKKKLVEDVVKEIKKDKQMEVRFNEQKFRDSAFGIFKNSNDEEYQNFQENQSQK